MTHSNPPLLLALALALALAVPAAGCSPSTTNTTNGEATSDEPAPPEEASGYSKLEDLVPSAPSGFGAAQDVTLRDRHTIFEQINGGSTSYRDNGMEDALFATYPPAAGDESAVLELEIYRFDSLTGAREQFKLLHAGAGQDWQHGSRAVLHEFGAELIIDRLIVRVFFNAGDAAAMGVAARVVAAQIAKRAAP